MQEPQYVRTPEGVRYRETEGRLGPTLQESLAMMYGRLEGMVMRYGESASVDAYYRRFTDELAGTTLAADLVMLMLDLDKLSLPPARRSQPRHPDLQISR